MTPQDIKTYLADKVKELASIAPGYSSIDISASCYPGGDPHPFGFIAYNEHTGHSPRFNDPDECIEWIREKVTGKKESEVARAHANEIIKRAEYLESLGK